MFWQHWHDIMKLFDENYSCDRISVHHSIGITITDDLLKLFSLMIWQHCPVYKMFTIENDSWIHISGQTFLFSGKVW